MVRIVMDDRGRTHHSVQRMIVLPEGKKTTSKPLAHLATWDPVQHIFLKEVEYELALTWLMNGAQPSEQAGRLLHRAGVIDEYVERRPKQSRKFRYLNKTVPVSAEAIEENSTKANRGSLSQPVGVRVAVIDRINVEGEPQGVWQTYREPGGYARQIEDKGEYSGVVQITEIPVAEIWGPADSSAPVYDGRPSLHDMRSVLHVMTTGERMDVELDVRTFLGSGKILRDPDMIVEAAGFQSDAYDDHTDLRPSPRGKGKGPFTLKMCLIDAYDGTYVHGEDYVVTIAETDKWPSRITVTYVNPSSDVTAEANIE